MEQKDWIDRKEAQARAVKLGQTDLLMTADAKPGQRGVITMSDSAFGGQALVKSEKPETHAIFKKEKAKTNKIMMNEQNWQLAQDRPDLYIPNKLPFFKPGEGNEEVQDENKIIKLQRTQSHYSVGIHESVEQADCEVKDLFMGQE